MQQEFRLPDLGEGLTEGEILGWLVAEGDEVSLNQPIVEVETAKAAVEVPSPYAGLVVRLHHRPGETVDVGTTIITVETGVADEAPAGRTAVLVGYGPKTTTATRRPRRAVPSAVAASGPGSRVRASRVAAKPPVRKLARDLGVDLQSLVGTGTGGVITRADVCGSAPPPPPSPASSPEAGTTRVPIKGVRKLIAANMVASAFTAPHVTEFLTCDVTATTELISRLRALPDFAGSTVTPLLVVARALLVACRRHPGINASWDEPAQEIVLHGAVNLGIAAATPRGLLVPNIKDAGSLGLADLARSLTGLIATAREGRTSPADMAGGTITVTNVGVYGVDTGTPILNPGEAAILCLGAIRDTPWVVDGQVVVRKVTTLALAFDHRLVDGQLGSEVLADVAAMLHDPTQLLAWS